MNELLQRLDAIIAHLKKRVAEGEEAERKLAELCERIRRLKVVIYHPNREESYEAVDRDDVIDIIKEYEV